ncbi:MAG TPA: transglutaminase domain-containing protein [Gemmatimonadaceae bacterium]|jgi:hypothetical protein
MTNPFLRWALSPVLRLAIRLSPESDPWGHLGYVAPLKAFGSGSRKDFSWYFEGESTVEARSIAEIRAWLAGCEYESDANLFQEPDFWQHPRTFEQLRKGDCEDFALWAWRKLVEMGIDADLVVGRTMPLLEGDSRHAWIVFRKDGKEYLFEPAWRGDTAIRPLAEVRKDYNPEFGVGANRKRFSYAGYVRYLQWAEQTGKAATNGNGQAPG